MWILIGCRTPLAIEMNTVENPFNLPVLTERLDRYIRPGFPYRVYWIEYITLYRTAPPCLRVYGKSGLFRSHFFPTDGVFIRVRRRNKKIR